MTQSTSIASRSESDSRVGWFASKNCWRMVSKEKSGWWSAAEDGSCFCWDKNCAILFLVSAPRSTLDKASANAIGGMWLVLAPRCCFLSDDQEDCDANPFTPTRVAQQHARDAKKNLDGDNIKRIALLLLFLVLCGAQGAEAAGSKKKSASERDGGFRLRVPGSAPAAKFPSATDVFRAATIIAIAIYRQYSACLLAGR